MYTEKRRFDWDPAKAQANRAKHGVSFEQAATAFDDPGALVTLDRSHSTEREIREWLVGMSDFGLVVVVFTQRGETCRLISARRVNRRERRRYEASKKTRQEKAQEPSG